MSLLQEPELQEDFLAFASVVHINEPNPLNYHEITLCTPIVTAFVHRLRGAQSHDLLDINFQFFHAVLAVIPLDRVEVLGKLFVQIVRDYNARRHGLPAAGGAGEADGLEVLFGGLGLGKEGEATEAAGTDGKKEKNGEDMNMEE